jgi:hypothetical protein
LKEKKEEEMKNPVYMLITRKMEEVSRRCSHRKYEQSGAFLSLYDYNFLLVIEKIFSENSKICLYALKGLQINMHLEDKNKEDYIN